MKRATVQCLHAMTTHGEEFWQPLLETGRKKNIIDLKFSSFLVFVSIRKNIRFRRN